ncbi:MAG: hypothetical protein WA966_08200 [Ornithinimicrobium sp.]
MQYWFNVDSHKVEAHDDPERARSANLLGPYDSQEEAESALEKAAERNQAWEADDDTWDDDSDRS